MLGLLPPLEGLLHSAALFNQTASNIARATLPGSGGQDSLDLSTAAVALLQSRNSFDANTKVIRTMDETDQTMINTIG